VLAFEGLLRRLGIALALLLAASCAARPRTQVTVVIEADEDVARDAVTLQVRGSGGRSLEDPFDYPVTLDERTRFPVDVALVPAGGDVQRRFRVEATAADARGASLGTVRAISGFVPGRTLTLTLTLESCCRAITCGVEETCRGCACVPALVEIERLDAHVVLPDAWAPVPVDASIASPDTPGADAFAPEPDAFAFDAFEPEADAHADDAIVLPPGAFSPNAPARPASVPVPRALHPVPPSRAGPPTGHPQPSRWSRPSAASCPATLAGGTYGYSVRRLYNPTGSTVRQRLRTLSGSGLDLFLALYAEPSPDLSGFPALPIDGRDCILAIDDTPGEAPNVVTSVDVPPRQAVIVVMTTSLPEAMGNAQLNFE